jgi:hypothetical protein
LLGDVNEDGTIDVYDVTLIIEFYLDGTFSFLADVDEDGKTDIYDITAAIEICLLERSPKSIVRSYDVTDVTDISCFLGKICHFWVGNSPGYQFFCHICHPSVTP